MRRRTNYERTPHRDHRILRRPFPLPVLVRLRHRRPHGNPNPRARRRTMKQCLNFDGNKPDERRIVHPHASAAWSTHCARHRRQHACPAAGRHETRQREHGPRRPIAVHHRPVGAARRRLEALLPHRTRSTWPPSSLIPPVSILHPTVCGSFSSELERQKPRPDNVRTGHPWARRDSNSRPFAPEANALSS